VYKRQVLPYAFDAFTVKVTGGIDLIGPDILALNGGQMAFWVRTNGKSDAGKVQVKFPAKRLKIDFKISGGKHEN